VFFFGGEECASKANKLSYGWPRRRQRTYHLAEYDTSRGVAARPRLQPSNSTGSGSQHLSSLGLEMEELGGGWSKPRAVAAGLILHGPRRA
jgi:phosphoenolpyruvate carboxylase